MSVNFDLWIVFEIVFINVYYLLEEFLKYVRVVLRKDGLYIFVIFWEME